MEDSSGTGDAQSGSWKCQQEEGESERVMQVFSTVQNAFQEEFDKKEVNFTAIFSS